MPEEPVIGQFDNHRIIASKPLANKGETVVAWDTETWGLDATAFAFGCTRIVSTGEQRVFFTTESLREYLESLAPCIAYAHNSARYDTFCLFSAREMYNAKKVANGTRIFELEVNGVKYRDSKHLLPMSLDGVAKSVEMAKGITPEAYIKGEPREITPEDIDYYSRS